MTDQTDIEKLAAEIRHAVGELNAKLESAVHAGLTIDVRAEQGIPTFRALMQHGDITTAPYVQVRIFKPL